MKSDVQSKTSRRAFWCGAIIGLGFGFGLIFAGIISQSKEVIGFGLLCGFSLPLALGIFLGVCAMGAEAIVGTVLLWFNPKSRALLQKIEADEEAEDAADDPRFAHVDFEATELDYSAIYEQGPAQDEQVPAPEPSSQQIMGKDNNPESSSQQIRKGKDDNP